MIGSVCGVLEVQGCCPVIGEVLRHLAGSTGSPLTNIAVHGGVEGVPANNVVNMSGWKRTRLAGGIKALKGQSRAWKAKASLNRRDDRESCREHLHISGGSNLNSIRNEEVEIWGSWRSGMVSPPSLL